MRRINKPRGGKMFKKILAISGLMLLAVLAASAQTFVEPFSAVTGIENAYLAKDNGKGRAGEPAENFGTNDIPIFCVVKLDSMRAVTVKLVLVAVDVPGVDTESDVVTISYKTNGMQDRVNFEGRPQDKWVAGTYRADIYLDDKKAQTIEFGIEKSITKPEANVPARSFRPKRRSN
jgi:hypothetical protein